MNNFNGDTNMNNCNIKKKMFATMINRILFIDEYDIAIIKLRRPIVFSQNVSAATLPTSDVPAGTNCMVIGWGKTHHDRKYLYNCTMS